MDQFIARVEQLTFGLGDEDIADAVWLARHMRVWGLSEVLEDKSASAENDQTSYEDNRGQDSTVVDPGNAADLSDRLALSEEEGEAPFSVFAEDSVTRSPGDLLPEEPSLEDASLEDASLEDASLEDALLEDASLEDSVPDQSSSEKGVPFQAPAAMALPNALELGRSLRPLMRKVPSATDLVLDSDATVNQIIEQDNWQPVLRPAPERWLDLELVIESSTVSVVWDAVIRDFRTKVLERQGAFRSIRTWTLREEAGHPCLTVQSGDDVGKRRGQPRELVHPSGRRLIMVLSDMRSPLWYQKDYQNDYQDGHPESPEDRSAEDISQNQNYDIPNLYRWLDYWGKKGPVVLVQLLPEWLWERSALDFGLEAQLGSVSPGTANQLWRLEGLTARQRGLVGADTALKIPVVTFDVDSLNDWARAVAGLGVAQVPGVVFNLANIGQLQQWNQAEVDQQGALTPDVLVDRFLGTASSMAQQLAGMMASVPVSLSVVRLIQSELLRDSTSVHVAEVFISDLIVPVGVNQRTRQPIYDFCHPEVRKLLIKALPTTTTHQVITALSKALGRKLKEGSITSFAAFLAPEPDWLDQGDEERIVARFAELLPDVLRTMGGAYATLAESATVLEQTKTVLSRQQVLADDDPVIADLPFPFHPLEFETARFGEEATTGEFPALEWRSFNVVQIEVGPTARSLLRLEPIEFQWVTLERNSSRQWIRKLQQGQTQQYVERLNQTVSLEMVEIPSGQFIMGEGLETHEVRVSKFYMGKYVVTQAQWRAVTAMARVNRKLKSEPSYFKGDDCPVERVSWHEAVEFCHRLSRHTKREYRLPSEAEWEYACRAGTTTEFHFGDSITTNVGNYGSPYKEGPKGKRLDGTITVGSLNAPNKFGLHDMHGNVWEWCQDHWYNKYEGGGIDDNVRTKNAVQSNGCVIRGGSWSSAPRHCRSAYRGRYASAHRIEFLGFRVVTSASMTP